MKATTLKHKIEERKAVIGVIGMGCIGLSLLEAFTKFRFPVRGYDVAISRVETLEAKVNPFYNFELEHFFRSLENTTAKISSEDEVLQDADVLIISVPTSLDEYNNPDLSCLRSAFSTVEKYVKNDQLIVLQSSTYPGCTEQELLPILKRSDKSFLLAHVPEIADIGNPSYTFNQIPRIVSGVDTESLETVSLLYEKIGCEIVPCSSTSVAEAAKLLQNAYRLINISFINELKVMLEGMGIDIWEVINAASSKPFGFVPFYPCPGIGGDCIPIDPFYLNWKSEQIKGKSVLLDYAGKINKSMPAYVISRLLLVLNNYCKCMRDSKVLMIGMSYKKDVNITHNSASLLVYREAIAMGAKVSYHDPYVNEIVIDNQSHRSIELNKESLENFDAVLIAVDHSICDWKMVAKHSQCIVDTRNVMDGICEAEGKVLKA
ncbi:MAG: nucleotide sugar dehydrogenase [Chlamydiota bacterium]|nr:nucleotide sugar dehydrogenase [Chlamydiota bacterium]